MRRGKQWTVPAAARRQRTAKRRLALLPGGLVLLCLLALAGCGGALPEPGRTRAETNPVQNGLRLADPWPGPQAQPAAASLLSGPGPSPLLSYAPPRNDGPHQTRGPRKAAAVGFAPGESFIDRALKLLASRHDSFAQELGLFDINEDGTPELMVITYGTWMRGFLLYDLSGRLPAFLGWHWGPDSAAYTRQTGDSRAWRLDGNYSHNFQYLEVSELFICAGGSLRDGLDIWVCSADSSPYHLPNAPWDPLTAPACWHYWVEHSLFRNGRAVFSDRREEDLAFPPAELLKDRAAQDSEGRPPAEQLEENEYPIAEMEERLEASLYRQLLSGGWTEVPRPWLIESDVYASSNFSNWVRIDLRVRLRRLYALWKEAHPKV